MTYLGESLKTRYIQQLLNLFIILLFKELNCN